MVMGTGIRDLRGMTTEIKYEDVFSDQNSTNRFDSGVPPILNEHRFIDLPNSPLSSTFSNPTASPPSANANTSSSLTTSVEVDSAEDSEIFSDIVLSYISQMLMEEDMDEKFKQFQEHPALLAAEKPFYDILAENFSPSPDQPLLDSNHSFESSEVSVCSASCSKKLKTPSSLLIGSDRVVRVRVFSDPIL